MTYGQGVLRIGRQVYSVLEDGLQKARKVAHILEAVRR